MIKLMTFALVTAFALGCGGSKKSSSTPTSNQDANTQTTTDTAKQGDGQPCTQEIMLECPEGQVDACTKTPAEGDTHKCVAK